MEISLNDVLNAREARVRLQQQFLAEYQCSLICFTMNIAGPVKIDPAIQRSFQSGLDALLARIPADSIRRQYVDLAPTGCTAMLAVAMDGDTLKSICVELEDSTPMGRLYDMDVLTSSGIKLERKKQRGCLVCGAPGRECAASRRHSVQELQSATKALLISHFIDFDSAYIADLAVQSLIDEVNTTPKPGLVDRRNNGSHKDMTLQHFLKSAKALHPYFTQCVKIGQCTAHLPAADTFPQLREAGLKAEQVMFQATGGVNTHKGAVYTMGILCGSLGRLWSVEKPLPSIDAILAECSEIAGKSIQSDLSAANGSTAGERYYLQSGNGGIRSEIAAGLPSVRQIGLPCYEKALQAGLSTNDAGAITLISLIARVADTNLYKRGGQEGLEFASRAAGALLPDPSLSDIEELDDAFIRRNLSPGGCADLLAVTYFLHSLK